MTQAPARPARSTPRPSAPAAAWPLEVLRLAQRYVSRLFHVDRRRHQRDQRPFTVTSGGQALATCHAHQRVAPTGTLVDEARWKLLGTVTAANGQLTITLTNAANGTVNADAIGVERISGDADALPLPKSDLTTWLATASHPATANCENGPASNRRVATQGLKQCGNWA
jgi:hypothetical protein